MATKRAGRPWRRLRAQVLAKSRVCWLCGGPGADSVDHIVPVSLGGPELDITNCAPAHLLCNLRRGNRLATTQPTVQHLGGSRAW